MRDEPFARAIERRRRGVVQRELALRGEERRPPAGPGGQFDDLARDGERIEPATGDVELGVPGRVVDGTAFVSATAEIPVVVFGRARLVIGEHLGVDVGVRGGRGGASQRRDQGRAGRGAASVRPGPPSRPPARSPLGQRLAQSEPQEPVLAGLADALGAELRPALEVIGPAADMARPAPQAFERRPKRHRPTYGPTGVHDPIGAMSTNASGSKISASSSMPSKTRGPGRLK